MQARLIAIRVFQAEIALAPCQNRIARNISRWNPAQLACCADITAISIQIAPQHARYRTGDEDKQDRFDRPGCARNDFEHKEKNYGRHYIRYWFVFGY